MNHPSEHEVTHAVEVIKRNSRIPPTELRLLTFLVENTLAGRAHEITQKTLASDVFGRDLRTFDPKTDSIVRTTVANLRNNLLSYYASQGRTDAIVIELPKGAYSPVFSRRLSLSPGGTSHLWTARVALEARTPYGFETASTHLDAVLAESPLLSLALALKAEALASKAVFGARPRPNLEEARVFAAKAIEAPSPVWQAWLSQAIVSGALDLNWTAAEQYYERALLESGDESATHPWYTAFLVGRGRPQEAIHSLQQSVDHFGFGNPTYLADLGMLQILARDYKQAGLTIDSALDVAPYYYQNHIAKATLLEAMGDPAGALVVLDRTPLTPEQQPFIWGLKALFEGLAGNRDYATERIAAFGEISNAGHYVPPVHLAVCWIGAGDYPKALAMLEQALEDRDPLAVWFHAYPFLRHLRGEPGFAELIGKIGVIDF